MILSINLKQTTPTEAQELIKSYLIMQRKSQGYTYSGLDFLCAEKNLPAGKVFFFENKSKGVSISTIFDLCELYKLQFVLKKQLDTVFHWPNLDYLSLFERSKRLEVLGAAICAGRAKRSRAWLGRVTHMNNYSLTLIERGSVGVKLLNLLLIAQALEWSVELEPLKQ